MQVTTDLGQQPQDKLRLIETMADWRAFKKEWKDRLAGVKVVFPFEVRDAAELPALLVLGPLQHFGTTHTTVKFEIIRNVAVAPEPEPVAPDAGEAPVLA